MSPTSAALNTSGPASVVPAPGTSTVAAPATLVAADGSTVAAGLVEIAGAGASWTATLARFDRPGLIASLFYGARVREVVLQLDDGRQGRATMTGTAFVAGGERVCHLAGIEPLA